MWAGVKNATRIVTAIAKLINPMETKMDKTQITEKALRITERNLTNGIWTLDTARFFFRTGRCTT